MKNDSELLKELTGWLDRVNLSIRSDQNQFKDWYAQWRTTEFEQPTEDAPDAAEGATAQSPPASDQVPDVPPAGAPDEPLHDSNTAEAEDGADSESGQSDQETPTVADTPVADPGSQ